MKAFFYPIIYGYIIALAGFALLYFFGWFDAPLDQGESEAESFDPQEKCAGRGCPCGADW